MTNLLLALAKKHWRVIVDLLAVVALMAAGAALYRAYGDSAAAVEDAKAAVLARGNLAIGQLPSTEDTAADLKKQIDGLLKDRAWWMAAAKHYKLKADSLIRTKIVYVEKTPAHAGEGGATTTAGVTAYAFKDWRLSFATPDVNAAPPVASYALRQSFKLTSLTMHDSAARKVAFVELAELDPAGKVIGKASIVQGAAEFLKPEPPPWYEHIILSGAAGARYDVAAQKVLAPEMRADVGYKAAQGFPWGVYGEAFAALDLSPARAAVGYGAGAFVKVGW